MVRYELNQLSAEGAAICAYCRRQCKGVKGLAQHTMAAHPDQLMAVAKAGTLARTVSSGIRKPETGFQRKARRERQLARRAAE